jgi:uncharacterized membrane protein YdjX (TVP38/TMEM64 family)
MGADANGPRRAAPAASGMLGRVHRKRPLLMVAVVAVVIAAGLYARDAIGVEFSSESIQAWVKSLGWKGPASYVALVAFRHFLLLPSMLVLSVGGVVFGAALGSLLGAIGITVTGLVGFGIVRGLRPESVLERLGEPARRFSRIIEKAGAWVVVVATGHPASPMSAFHWGAGLTSMPVVTFAIALAIGALLRAFAYAFFGSTLLSPGTPRFYVAALVLLLATAVPLAHPAVRRRILEASTSPGTTST